ncbi:hypothetical protein M097_3917 [Phocaeicola vulgatus str. 3775 SL(B) 10 (iv)]|uniref:Uncharacterized protein n=1 Tax=Phocaeicola vulgatus str. 3775 SL(B) 10 (iv) TaxID=1339350 RepID=A0A078QWS7_PHOVU|nr:hypothetical protein M097_3917 [Phocaeicola vulgatus str. 3775 SL(B) 10 (iv)]
MLYTFFSVFHLLLYHIGNITIFRIFNISPFITGKEYTNKTNGLATMP